METIHPRYGELLFVNPSICVYYHTPGVYTVIGIGPDTHGTVPAQPLSGALTQEYLDVVYQSPTFQQNHAFIMHPNGVPFGTDARDFYRQRAMRPATLLVGVASNPVLRVLGTLMAPGIRRFLGTKFVVCGDYQTALQEARAAVARAAEQGTVGTVAR